jgi:hypothetical protein
MIGKRRVHDKASARVVCSQRRAVRQSEREGSMPA